MKIIKTANPEVAITLIPMYVEVDMGRIEIAEELFARLCNKPEDTLVLALTEDDGTLCGMAVAYTREEDVFIWQAHAMPNTDRRWIDIALGMIIG